MGKKRKILILNVDRDDDIGIKAGIITPIIGYDNILDAAKTLLMKDPEEADGNALFASLKLYNELKDKFDEVEVAAVTGTPAGGVEADIKISEQLDEVLQKFNADSIILVTDGYSDEEIIPIVSSKRPIISIHRIVVKHSKSIEETYAVLGRYIKMLWTESPYKEYFIGVPGIIMLIVGILSLLNLTREAVIYSLIIIGLSFIIKGLGIDEYLSSLRRAHFYEYVKLATYLGAIATLLSGVYLSYTSVSGLEEFKIVVKEPARIFDYGAVLLGHMMPYIALTILTVSLFFILGFSLYNILTENYDSLYKYPVAMVSAVVFYFVANEIGNILISPQVAFSNLFLYVTVGFLAIFITSALMFALSKIKK